MLRLVRYALLSISVIAGFAPAIADSRVTPGASPPSGAGVEMMVLADTTGLEAAAGEGATVPGVAPARHRLLRFTMEPGAGFDTGIVLHSALVYVESGRVTVVPADTRAHVRVGSGDTIVSDDGDVLCSHDSCAVEPGQAIVLGPGNGLAVEKGALRFEGVDSETTVFQVSALFTPNNDQRCWICPFT